MGETTQTVVPLPAMPEVRLRGIPRKQQQRTPDGVIVDYFAGDDGELYCRVADVAANIVKWARVGKEPTP